MSIAFEVETMLPLGQPGCDATLTSGKWRQKWRHIWCNGPAFHLSCVSHIDSNDPLAFEYFLSDLGKPDELPLFSGYI